MKAPESEKTPPPMPGKTQASALVVIPPEEAWEPIQAIRRIHDRKFARWMPHVTLLYPFRPREEFGLAGKAIEEACGAAAPFEVRLARFRWFVHGRTSATIWLAPEPAAPLLALQSALEARFPDCDEVRLHPEGFTPHLSVGQAPGERDAERLARALETGWGPLAFEISSVAMIAREEEGPFEVVRLVPLWGGGA